MKISHSASYFLLILISLALVFTFISNRSKKEDKILLQTLACQSDKIDQSILSLNAKTSLIGAYINFKQVPISPAEKEQFNKLEVIIDEKSWIFERAQAQIPTTSLCELIQSENIDYIFIPQFN